MAYQKLNPTMAEREAAKLITECHAPLDPDRDTRAQYNERIIKLLSAILERM